ncbi:MAG: Trk system potassium transporter TrkA [Clostridia bacterium]|nr:Trk system potassium transporter TrkA [Clostridia bacterium]
MKIIVIGNGSVGDALIGVICSEGHNVTVIDEELSVVNEVVNKYDVFGITGNGASIEVQKEAGVRDCDVVIAVSPGDELNLLCCMIAKQLGAKHAIARVRDPRYLNQVGFMSKQMGIDMIVNPEHEAAREAARLIRFPAAIKLEKFARGQVEVVEIHVGEDHPFIGLALKDFKNKFNTNTLICTAVRGDEVFIPGGDFVICEGDLISLAGSRQDINELFVKIGLVGKEIKDVLLIGGGRISRYLATQLGKGYKLKIIEKNPAICDELADLFPKIQIINGDATDPDILDEEGLGRADACVAMTENDQTNLIISMFANSRNVEKVISKIASPTFVKLSENAGIDSNITPQFLIIAKVLRYIRGLANRGEKGSRSAIKSLHKIAENRVEALEFDVADDFEQVGKPLKDIKWKKNILVAAVIRDNAVIYAHGSTTLEVGDSVIIVTTNKQLCDLEDTLA